MSSSASLALPTTVTPASRRRLRQPLADQHRVVGDDYPHGSSARILTPPRRGRARRQPAIERADAVGDPDELGQRSSAERAHSVVDLDVERRRRHGSRPRVSGPPPSRLARRSTSSTST